MKNAQEIAFHDFKNSVTHLDLSLYVWRSIWNLQNYSFSILLIKYLLIKHHLEVLSFERKRKKKNKWNHLSVRQKRDPTWDTYAVANWSSLPTTVGFLEIWDLECWPRWVPGTSGRLVPSQGQRPGYKWSKMANQMQFYRQGQLKDCLSWAVPVNVGRERQAVWENTPATLGSSIALCCRVYICCCCDLSIRTRLFLGLATLLFYPQGCICPPHTHTHSHSPTHDI